MKLTIRSGIINIIGATILITADSILLIHNWSAESSVAVKVWCIICAIFWFLVGVSSYMCINKPLEYTKNDFIRTLCLFIFMDIFNSCVYFAGEISTDELRTYALVITIFYYIVTVKYIICTAYKLHNLNNDTTFVVVNNIPPEESIQVQIG